MRVVRGRGDGCVQGEECVLVLGKGLGKGLGKELGKGVEVRESSKGRARVRLEDVRETVRME